METVDLRNAGYANNALLENMIRLFGNVVTRALLSADFVALTIPRYVELLTEKYKADNVLLAPHGSFEEIDAPVFDAPDSKQSVMTFGKFGTYKRVEPLIEAFAQLKAEGHPDLELVIAGGNSPNAPGYLEEMQAQYAHVPDVIFTGYVAEEDVPGLFQDSTVTVFPYTSTTGSSGVLHQAGSYGKAAVLPKIGDFAEVIAEEGYAGEFFEPGDVDSMAKAIAHVLDDPEHRRALGLQNFMASNGIPIADVVDWYLLHIETL
jgi:glycosyltransferase involved in cell wall biosynthesis